MKRQLLFIFFSSFSVISFSQWTTGTGGTLYYLPTTTLVGIGTTSPNSKLHLNSATGQNALRVDVNGLSKLTVASNGGVTIGTLNNTPPANGLYVFGKAGIGTNTPSCLLDIIGDGTTEVLNLKGSLQINSDRGVALSRSSYGSLQYYFTLSTNGGPKGLRFSKASDGIRSNAKDVLFLGENEYVGIGMTNPTSRLTVNGRILCEGVTVIVDVPNSDYVFDKEYKLLSLPEVEKYVTENKHLPGIPSASEFKENGYSLAKMDDLLLKKLEELTLYVIDLKKENEVLKQEVASLKK